MQMRDVVQLSKEHDVFVGDTLLLALNLYGLDTPGGLNRARTEVTLDDAPTDEFPVIIPMNRSESPFTLSDDYTLRFGGERVGCASAPRHDDAIGGYFRKGGTAVTINPNARSRCTGCVFCPNTLEAAADPRLRDMKTLNELLDVLALQSSSIDPLSAIEDVTISTGCYEQEARAVAFLTSVREVLTSRGLAPELGFLTSVLRSDSAFDEIAARVGSLRLYVTLECLSRRRLLLKSTKASLLPEDVPDLMQRARSFGLRPTYNYIVGLDPLSDLGELIEMDAQSESFPNYQVYQAHNALMAMVRAPGADELEYYLLARRIIERSWMPRQARIESWRNYRPLWYYTFGHEPIAGPRI